MASNYSPPTNEVAHEFLPYFRVYKDGRTERLRGTDTVPPSTDPVTGVQSKDVVILPENQISARFFLPKVTDPHKKFPVLVYVHGGAFAIETPFSPLYTTHLNAVTAEANVVVMAIHYRRAPEHRLPIAHEDTWAALQWAATQDSEPWLKNHADLERVYLAGDSAGANLAHYAAVRAGIEKPAGLKIVGFVAIHPFFVKDKVPELINFLFPANKGARDPTLNPAADPGLVKMGCKRVLIFVAEKDFIRESGWYYYEVLKQSEWDGEVQIVQTEGEEHVFHLFNHESQKAAALRTRFASFLNGI